MSTPVWFLDIDGVINSVPAPKHHQLKTNGPYEHKIIEGYPIWYNPVVIDFINRMAREERAEVLWLTTWTDKAAEVFAPTVGLSEFRVLNNTEGSDYPFLKDWWKFKRVCETVEASTPERKVVWTDDDMGTVVKREFRARFDPERERSLLVQPTENPGLTLKNLREIEDFLA